MISKEEWDSLRRNHEHEETAFVSRYINSPCYHFITRFLIDKNITPNQVSIATLFIGLISAIFYAHGNFILGGILVQLTSIVDGVDGEIARIKHSSSKFGEVVDSLCDRGVEAAICLGIGYGVWVAKGTTFAWIFSFLGIVGFFLGNYLTELAKSRVGEEIVKKSWERLHKSIKFRLNHRSNQFFIIFLFSLFGMPEISLLIVALISFFYSVVRFQKMLPDIRKLPRW
jgi:CDP-L-myo-inositol myo-inositolphosphotransferase